ncbi:hypothetical protein BaRGS_00036685 [Batillaria attramentaria]|uniref:Uncharacterized protein n=1 Tax=Batillaria attramentaria TaxID=370345 RepID=A0ABD0JAT9_9CAEN
MPPVSPTCGFSRPVVINGRGWTVRSAVTQTDPPGMLGPWICLRGFFAGHLVDGGESQALSTWRGCLTSFTETHTPLTTVCEGPVPIRGCSCLDYGTSLPELLSNRKC